jgi:hypothetical protein
MSAGLADWFKEIESLFRGTGCEFDIQKAVPVLTAAAQTLIFLLIY